jgi:hypothetical protein
VNAMEKKIQFLKFAGRQGNSAGYSYSLLNEDLHMIPSQPGWFTILRTLPLSGRQEAIAIEAGLTAACPLQVLVRRCRISTGSVCGPTPHPQNSSHVRFAAHTRAQLQTQAVTTFRMVSKLGLRSPEKAL